MSSVKISPETKILLNQVKGKLQSQNPKETYSYDAVIKEILIKELRVKHK